jgi:hypothetical protein
VFLYTDNQTAEGSYFRGTAKSRALFELIVTLYNLQMQFDFILHVVWIAGTRMIQQGAYGLSRGEENGIATCGMALGGGSTTFECNSTEWDVGRLDPWMDRHGEEVGSVRSEGVVHLGSQTGIHWVVPGAGRIGCGH